MAFSTVESINGGESIQIIGREADGQPTRVVIRFDRGDNNDVLITHNEGNSLISIAEYAGQYIALWLRGLLDGQLAEKEMSHDK